MHMVRIMVAGLAVLTGCTSRAPVCPGTPPCAAGETVAAAVARGVYGGDFVISIEALDRRAALYTPEVVRVRLRTHCDQTFDLMFSAEAHRNIGAVVTASNTVIVESAASRALRGSPETPLPRNLADALAWALGGPERPYGWRWGVSASGATFMDVPGDPGHLDRNGDGVIDLHDVARVQRGAR